MTTEREIRLAEGYEPRFDADYALGRQSELLVCDLIESLREGIAYEVKTDEKFLKTGRVFFEYQCCYGGLWKSTGIGATEAALWFHWLSADGPVLVFEVSRLKAACRAMLAAQYTKSCMRGSHPTRGVCAPLHTVLTYYAGSAHRPEAA